MKGKKEYDPHCKGNFVSCFQVDVEVSQRHQQNTVADMTGEDSRLRQQLEEEIRVSQRIEEYLKKHYQDLAGKVDHWMTKHENDLEMKTKDLHDLKVNNYLGKPCMQTNVKYLWLFHTNSTLEHLFLCCFSSAK